MQVLDAKAAAEAIRAKIESGDQPSAESRHIESFVTKVCEHLGIEPNTANVAHVAQALRDADIQPHVMREYPKMLVGDDGKPVTDAAGNPIIFETAEDEAAHSEPASAPALTDPVA